jgi:pyruvate,water dikinase
LWMRTEERIMPSDRAVVFMGDVEADEVARFGGKAVNTSRLHRGGFKVPAGFSISGLYYGDLIAVPEIQSLIRTLESTEDLEEMLLHVANLEELVREYEMPEDLKSRILDAKMTLERESGERAVGYAVRSSATVEDGTSISFAGQAESYLCVTSEEDLLESVKRVWQSVLTPRALIYLQSKGIPVGRVRMGVIVQEMVPADVSGVLFTANVVTSDKNQVLVEAVRGLGEPLVSGRATPDTYIVEKGSFRIKEQRLGKMASMLVATTDGTAEVPISEELRGAPVLDAETLHVIIEAGLGIEELMGSPQDIEWCLEGGQLVVLQSRPITTL